MSVQPGSTKCFSTKRDTSVCFFTVWRSGAEEYQNPTRVEAGRVPCSLRSSSLKNVDPVPEGGLPARPDRPGGLLWEGTRRTRTDVFVAGDVYALVEQVFCWSNADRENMQGFRNRNASYRILRVRVRIEIYSEFSGGCNRSLWSVPHRV